MTKKNEESIRHVIRDVLDVLEPVVISEDFPEREDFERWSSAGYQNVTYDAETDRYILIAPLRDEQLLELLSCDIKGLPIWDRTTRVLRNSRRR